MADKKISELDAIGALTGSNPIFPLVQGGNTLQINASALAVYASQWSTTTSSFNTFVSTQNAVNLGIAIVTGSFNQFTASLDATYATDAQLLPILQATASIQSATASINTSITSLNSFSSSIQTEVGNIEAYTASLKSAAIVSSSQQILNYNIFVTTSSLNTYTSSQNLVNLGISIVTGSLNQQTSSQDLVNLGISEVTSSLNLYTSSNESWKDGVRGEVNGLEAYTASLKGAIEVNGQDVNVLGMITAQQFNVTYVSSSTLYQSGSTKFGDTSDDRHEFTGSVDISGSITVSQGNVEATSFSGSFHAYTNTLGKSTLTGGVLETTSELDIAGYEVGLTMVNAAGNKRGSVYLQPSDGQTVVHSLNGPLTLKSNTGEVLMTGSLDISGSLVVQSGASGSFSGSFTGNGAGLTQVPSASIASDLYKPTGTISVGIGGDSNIIQISGSLIQLGNPTLYTETLVNRQLAVSGGITVHNTLGNGFATIGVNNAGDTQIGANNNLNILLKNDGRNILYNGVEITGSLSVQNDVEAVNLIGSLLSTNGVVSSSTQISNYYKFAETASANTFYGNQTISGSLVLTGSVTSSKVLTDSVRFNTSAGVSVGVGELAWNNSDGTLDLGMKGGNVVQQIGQEIFYEVRNDTGIEIPNGTVVYANGVTAGSGRITVAPYTADGSVREVRFLGIATENISTGVNGFVTHFGYVRGLDTRGTTASSIAVGDEDWSVGDVLYVHPTVAGKLTNVPPKHEISAAIVITRHQSVGVLFVRPTSYGHLDDIHDVQITTASLSTGQMLVYNSGTDYWENTNSLSGSYQLTGSLNVTGSVNIDNVIKLTPVTTATFPSGEAGMLVASSSYGFTNLYMYDGSDWKWLLTGSIQ
jgi:hypothetical protein